MGPEQKLYLRDKEDESKLYEILGLYSTVRGGEFLYKVITKSEGMVQATQYMDAEEFNKRLEVV